MMNMAAQLKIREEVSNGFAPANRPTMLSGLVLVVDDEPMLRRMMRRTLERFGFDVVEASDGQQAIELLQRLNDQISLVLMDWNMPILTGEETLAGLRQSAPEVPVLVLSGYGDMHDEMRAMGAQGFLPKPFRPSGLEEMLRGVLG
jgi:CheY-like chemotaxis protein